MIEQRWISRQGDAAMAFIPIIALAAASSIGAGVSAALGVTVWFGVIVFGVAGFLLSRTVLRWYFGPRSQPPVDSSRSSNPASG